MSEHGRMKDFLYLAGQVLWIATASVLMLLAGLFAAAGMFFLSVGALFIGGLLLVVAAAGGVVGFIALGDSTIKNRVRL